MYNCSVRREAPHSFHSYGTEFNDEINSNTRHLITVYSIKSYVVRCNNCFWKNTLFILCGSSCKTLKYVEQLVFLLRAHE